MRKKLLSVCTLFAIIVLFFGFVNAQSSIKTSQTSLININSYEDIYKLSEQGEKIDLPFFNMFFKSATYDSIVTHSGITYGHSTVDINQKLEGLHLIFSDDMVTIKGEIENGIIYGNNIVVSGKISGDTILMSPNVKVLKDATIEKDVIIIANNLELEGTVNGNVIATVANDAKVTGKIAKDLRMVANSFELSNSIVNGNVYLETDADTTEILNKYPNATIVKAQDKEVNKEKDIFEIITKGIVTVIIYTAVCYFVTKKENNVFNKALQKFKAHTAYGITFALLYFILFLFIILGLILLIILGLGVIAWPVLIVCISLLLFSISTATFIVGVTIYEAIKSKVGKYKLPVMALIYMLLYVICAIDFVSYYAIITINLVALAIIITMLTRKIKQVGIEEQEK